MNLTLSPPIKILALVGLIGVLGLGASTLVLGKGAPTVRTSTAQPHSGASTTPAKTPSNTRPAQSTSAPVTTTPATAASKHQATATVPVKKHATVTTPATTPVATTPARTPAKPHAKTAAATPAKTHAKVRPAAHRAARGNLVYEDLPKPLQWQLAQHKVVVVSLYNPHAEVDAISVAEAHAGAADTKAGFLLVNVLDDKVAGLLTGLLPGGGLLPDPGVLVYRAPGDIMVRLDGFADRDSVAQAVTNALADPKVTPAASTTAAPAAAAAVPAAPATTGAPTPTTTP